MISVTTFDRSLVNNNHDDDQSKENRNGVDGDGGNFIKKSTRVSNTAIPKEGNTKRYYHPNEVDFKRDLEQYASGTFVLNEKRKRWSCLHSTQPNFICVGRVNVNLKFCSACYDVGKKGYKNDLYYIDSNDKTRYRTVLCRGCIGILITPNKCNSKIRKEELVPGQMLTDVDVYCKKDLKPDLIEEQLPTTSSSNHSR